MRRYEYEKTQLTNLQSFSYHKEQANNAVGILLEAYNRSLHYPSDVHKNLRRLIAFFLTKQAKLFALDGNYSMARRKAFESSAFLPRGRTALKAFVGLLFPRLFHLLAKEHLKP